jgi:hypothetical protein
MQDGGEEPADVGLLRGEDDLVCFGLGIRCHAVLSAREPGQMSRKLRTLPSLEE